MNPIIGASIIGAGSSLLGNLLGSKNTSDTNKTNREINQMNNEFNAQEAVKNRDFITSERNAQNQWNLDQWNRENEYNSAASQRSRLEEAGLNPYLMMSGGSAGTAGSVVGGSTGSGSQASSAAAPAQIPFLSDFDSIGTSVLDGINSYFENKYKKEQTRGLSLSNDLVEQFGPDKNRAEIASLLDGRFEFLNPSYAKGRFMEAPNLLGVDLATRAGNLQKLNAEISVARATESLTYLNADAQRVMNKYLPAQQQGELMAKAATSYSQYASGRLSMEKLRTEIASQFLMYTEADNLSERTRGQFLQNEFDLQTFGARVKGRKATEKIAYNTADAIISAMNEENRYNQQYYSLMNNAARDLFQFSFDTAKYQSRNARESWKLTRKNRRWYGFKALTGAVRDVGIGVNAINY